MNGVTEEKIIDALKHCYDPEISLNIYDLGLVYGTVLEEEEGGASVHIEMTLTAPGCPVAPMIIDDVKQKVGAVPGVAAVDVELVFDPPWDPERMSQAAKLEVGLL